MSFPIRGLTGVEASALVVHVNKFRLDALKMRAGLIFHADATQAVTAADITSGSLLAAQVAIVADCSTQYTAHIASACNATTGQGAHIAADVTNVITTPAGTDLTTCYARINELKALINLHIAVAAAHASVDSTNTVSATDATTAGTLATLANQVKAKLNSHAAAAMNSYALLVVSP